MKYKLINSKTKEEYLCDKVVVNGYDYYLGDIVTDIETQNVWHTNCDSKFHPFLKFIGNTFYAVEEFKKGNFKKVIATNSPRIGIPKVVNIVEGLADKLSKEYSVYETGQDDVYQGIIVGYNKSQETHPNSDEDMIEFAKWLDDNMQQREYYPMSSMNYKELLQLWKEQQPKIVYYE